MEAHKGDAGIVREDVCGVDEIDRRAEKSHCEKITARRKLDLPIFREAKWQGIEINTAGVKGKNSADLEADLASEKGFVKRFDDLEDHEKRPKRQKQFSLRAFRLFRHAESGMDDNCQKTGGEYEMKRRKEPPGQVEPAEKVFMSKEIFNPKQRGSGIGLSLCKQIMTLHGGSISVPLRWIQSRKGHTRSC